MVNDAWTDMDFPRTWVQPSTHICILNLVPQCYYTHSYGDNYPHPTPMNLHWWKCNNYYRPATRYKDTDIRTDTHQCLQMHTVTHTLDPVTTILPDWKTRAVDLGERILMMTAEKRLGLYSALRARKAICLRSNWQPKLVVATIFLIVVRNNIKHENICIWMSVHVLSRAFGAVVKLSGRWDWLSGARVCSDRSIMILFC